MLRELYDSIPGLARRVRTALNHLVMLQLLASFLQLVIAVLQLLFVHLQFEHLDMIEMWPNHRFNMLVR